MAHINLSRSHSVVEYDGFEGIDGSKIHSGKGGIKSISDFRIRFDGSSEKRYGFESLIELPGKPRALHQTKEKEFLALIGNTLYLIDLEAVSCTALDELLFPSEGDASFIEYCENIYLIDGCEVYVLFQNKLFTVDGYAPLYGKGWSCVNGGRVNEPFNMLSRHIRISFNLNSGSTSKIYLPFNVSTLDAAFLDGKPEVLGRYTLLSDNTINVATDAAYLEASELLLYLTVGSDVIDRSVITSCRSVCAYGDGSNMSIAAFYNGKDSSCIFPARPVSDKEYSSYFSTYPFTFKIYVSEADAIKANDRGDAITSVCPGNGELLVFSARSAATIYSPYTGENYLTCISSFFGCSSQNGAVIADDMLITVSDHGVLKWKPLSYENPEYDTVCISRKIHDVFGEAFAKNAIVYHYKGRNEIWFCDPEEENGTVVIYSTESDSWFSFSGIGAQRIFEIDGEICFTKDNVIYGFSRSRTSDSLVDEDRPIIGRIESGIIMLAPCNESKKLSRCIIRTSPGASLSLTVTDAKGRSVRYRLSDKSGERMGYMERRLDLYRSRYYSFLVETEENAVIYGITLIAQD